MNPQIDKTQGTMATNKEHPHHTTIYASAVIPAPLEEVWNRAGTFADLSWGGVPETRWRGTSTSYFIVFVVFMCWGDTRLTRGTRICGRGGIPAEGQRGGQAP